MILDDDDDTAFMPAPAIWSETRHELPPYEVEVMGRVDFIPGLGERRVIRYRGRGRDIWHNKMGRAVAIVPTHWRYLSAEEKSR